MAGRLTYLSSRPSWRSRSTTILRRAALVLGNVSSLQNFSKAAFMLGVKLIVLNSEKISRFGFAGRPTDRVIVAVFISFIIYQHGRNVNDYFLFIY